MIIRSIIENINDTPLIELKRIYKGKGHLFAKMEYVQPGGSIKDRAALQIIKDALDDGRLVRNQPVIEQTSGNMGSGLAVVCMAYENPFTHIGISPYAQKTIGVIKPTPYLYQNIRELSNDGYQVARRDVLCPTSRWLPI